MARESSGLKRWYSTKMLVLLVGLMAIAIVGCGGSDDDESSDAAAPATSTTQPAVAAPTTAPADSAPAGAESAAH